MAVARRTRVLWFKFRDAKKREWRVFLVKKLKHNGRLLAGLTQYEQRVILVHYTNDHRGMCETTLHECCHAGGDGVEVTHPHFDLVYAAEEDAVKRIEPGLWAILSSLGFSFPPIPDDAALLAA
jgi:hypothetical protein